MKSRPHSASQHLAAIVESSDDAIVSMDLDGIVRSWNRAAERMFGYLRDEIVGKVITTIVPPDRRGEEAEVLRRIRASERIEHFETVRVRKDGSLIDVSLTISPIHDRSGRVVGASKIARDISGRKRSQAALADLHQRLVSLIEASTRILRSPTVEDVQAETVHTARQLLPADGYALWRLDQETRMWRVANSYGISDAFASRVLDPATPGDEWDRRLASVAAFPDVAKEPLLRSRLDAFEAEGVAAVLLVGLVVRGKRAGTLVFYYRRPQVFTQVELQTAEALGSLAATALTTASLYEAAEHAKDQATFLARASELLGTSLDYEKTLAAVANLAVPYIADWCAVDIVDSEGRIKRLAVAHVDPEKVALARVVMERYPEDPASSIGIARVIRTGEPVMIEWISPDVVAAAAHDETHHQLLQQFGLTSYICVPLTARNRTMGAFTLLNAESRRRFTDEDLQTARALAARAALAIDNANAYREATDANRLKDDFLATLSHELRTPLNAVTGYAKMLSMNVLDAEKQANAVKVIHRNAVSLKQIIDDVLDVSRIVAGKLRLNVQPVNVAHVVTQAMTTITPAADAKSIQVEARLDPEVAPVSADPDRLQQIVWNLLSNAVKFTATGGHIDVDVHQDDDHVVLLVRDNGRGIAREFLPHIFERFRQADSAFSRDHGGLGLGLAIVRELVELHGGSVEATSEGPGAGAMFRVRLPIISTRAAEPRTTERTGDDVPPGTTTATPPRIEGVKVLAVDDERDARGLLREILKSAGAEVWTAGSGKQALAVLEHFVPDVIVADLGMPDLDGLEFIRRVRSELPAPARDVPAAALTAYARAQDRALTLVSGFQMHLPKPVDPVELVSAVAALAVRSPAASR